MTDREEPVMTKSILAAPLQCHHQFNGWSCGFFTMMVMQNLVKIRDLELVQGDKKDTFRSEVLKRILEIL